MVLPYASTAGNQWDMPIRAGTYSWPYTGLVKKYPDLKLILAYMGGGLPFYEMNPKYQGKFQNVCYDTAAPDPLFTTSAVFAPSSP